MMQCHCIPLWYQFSGKDDLSVSACMDGQPTCSSHLMTAVTKHHEVCWVKCNVPSSHFPISSFLPLASSPGHSQILSCHGYMTPQPHGCEIKSGSGLGRRLPPASVHSPFHSTVHSIFQSSDFRDAPIFG